MTESGPPPPDPTDLAAVGALAQAFAASGFASERVQEVVGGASGLTPLPLVVRRLAPDGPVGTLVALFAHGVPVDADAAERATVTTRSRSRLLMNNVGDQISRSLVEAAPAHLTEGGVAQFLVNWIHRGGADWSDPVRAWVDRSGCDAWLLHGASDDPGRYAVAWNSHLSRDPAAHAAAIERWLAWFDAAGVEAIGFGLVTLRRRAGATWFRADELPDAPGPAAGAQLEATLDAHDALAALDDLTDLLAARPVTNPEHRLEQILTFGDHRYEVQAARVRLVAPLPFTADVDVFAATLLTLLDGSRTLAEAIELTAPVLDETPADLPTRTAALVASMVVMGLVRLSAHRTAHVG